MAFCMEEWRGSGWTVKGISMAFEEFVRRRRLRDTVSDLVEATAVVLRERRKEESKKGVEPACLRANPPLGPDVSPGLFRLQTKEGELTLGERLYLLTSVHGWCCTREAGKQRVQSHSLLRWDERTDEAADDVELEADDVPQLEVQIAHHLAFQGRPGDFDLTPRLASELRKVVEEMSQQDDGSAATAGSGQTGSSPDAGTEGSLPPPKPKRGRKKLNKAEEYCRTRFVHAWRDRGNGVTREQFVDQYKKIHGGKFTFEYLELSSRTVRRNEEKKKLS